MSVPMSGNIHLIKHNTAHPQEPFQITQNQPVFKNQEYVADPSDASCVLALFHCLSQSSSCQQARSFIYIFNSEWRFSPPDMQYKNVVLNNFIVYPTWLNPQLPVIFDRKFRYRASQKLKFLHIFSGSKDSSCNLSSSLRLIESDVVNYFFKLPEGWLGPS